MYFQCVLILALSLVQNEAAKRLSFVKNRDPSRAIRSGSSKLIQGTFDTAAELAKLIEKVKNDAGNAKGQLQFQTIEDTSTPDEETNLQAFFNVIQKKMNNEGIRIHVLKNSDVLDKYKVNLGSRAVFIDNPEVLEKYAKEVKNQKTYDTQQSGNFGNLLLERRNAVFRMEDPRAKGSETLVKPKNVQDSKNIRKRTEGGRSEEKLNKGTKERGWEMSSGIKQRDMLDRSREVKKDVRENRGYKNERENRGFKNEQENRGLKNGREDRGLKNEREDRGLKNEREDRGLKNERENRGFKDVRERPVKREFKDYPDFKSQGNPNLALPKPPPPKVADYDYDKPRKPKKAVPRDYDDDLESKNKNKDKFDDYGGNKKKGEGWGQSIGSEPRRKPVEKKNWDDKPKRNFDNNERPRPKKEEGWAPSIRGSSDYNQRSSKNNEGYGFGNTPIPFNRPRNIYVNERGE